MLSENREIYQSADSPKFIAARELSWKNFGKEITFYLPGMFTYYGLTGRYSAVSITGDRCALQCDHCQAKILKPMIATDTPARLLEKCIQLDQSGHLGVLISGGSDNQGRLPWNDFIETIAEIKRRTGLIVSVHSGLLDFATARALKDAGVDQALIDVIGDDETFKRIYHVDFGVARIAETLNALNHAGLPVVPHIVCGIDYGQIKGEYQAITMLTDCDIEQVVVVALMHIKGTPIDGSALPAPNAVADVIADARLKLPQARLSLGCARQRGNRNLEMLAIDAGVNRMALPSDEAIAHAEGYGLNIRYQRTCCSVVQDLSRHQW